MSAHVTYGSCKRVSPRRRRLPTRPRREPVGPWGEYVNDLRVRKGWSYKKMYDLVNATAEDDGEPNTRYGRHTIRNWIGGVVPTSADTLRWIATAWNEPIATVSGKADGHRTWRYEQRAKAAEAETLVQQPVQAGEAETPVQGAPESVGARRSNYRHLLTTTALGLSGDEQQSQSQAPPQEPSDMERRGFLTLVSAIAAAAASDPHKPGTWEALATAAAVDPVLQVIPQYRRLDGQIPSAQLLDPVRAHLSLATQLTSQASTPWARGQLASGASEAASFTAWLLLDMNDPSKAREYYRIAVQLAGVVGNPLLHVYQLGSLAALAAELGDATQALALCRHLTQLLPSSAPCTAVAWLASLQAVAHAVAGQDIPSLYALEQAESLVGKGSHDLAWPWLSPFDTGKLLATSARCHLMLDRLPTALQLHERALSHDAVSTRRRGELLIGLANIHARLRQPEPVCLALTQAHDMAVATGSRQLLTRIHAVRDQLHPWADIPAVTQLDERLHTTWF